MSSQNIPTEIPIHHVSALSDDDVFAISEDPSSFVFSPDAIREEIARNLDTAWSQTQDLQSTAFEEHNTSVSTLDINGNTQESQLEPVSPDADTSILSSEFSQISLSNDTHDVDRCAEPDDHGQSDTPYPNIVIDASEAPTHRVTLTLDHAVPTPHSSPPETSPAASTRSLPPEIAAHSSNPDSLRESASVSTPTIPPLSITTNIHKPSASSEDSQKNTQLPVEKPATHRPTRSTGPSMFEKVRSKTRPAFLPPKPKAEDERHLADWQNMMRLSRLAGPFA